MRKGLYLFKEIGVLVVVVAAMVILAFGISEQPFNINWEAVKGSLPVT